MLLNRLKCLRQILGRDHVHTGYFHKISGNQLPSARAGVANLLCSCVKNLRQFQLRNAHIRNCRERVYLPFTKHKLFGTDGPPVLTRVD